MKRGEASCSKKLERKTIEKNRRIRMKALGFKLVSIIPDRHFSQPKELLSQVDQIDEAGAYIKNLRERIEGLKRAKAEVQERKNGGSKSVDVDVDVDVDVAVMSSVRELGSVGVEVVLICGIQSNTNFMLSKAITIIEQEAAQVLAVNISRLPHNQLIYTIHAKVKISRVGVDTSRISDRIHEMIISSC